MSREIKFRAWDEISKNMSHNILDARWTMRFVEDNRVDLMQFTGLHDKNGVEIYEGDIILSKYWDERIDKFVRRFATVIFEDGCFKVQGVENEYWRPSLVNIIGKTWTVEVNGNIYESPELLKK